MWNIASPASAYRLKSINEAIQSLEILKADNNDNKKPRNKTLQTFIKVLKKDIIIKNLDLINLNFIMSLNQMIF